MEKNEGLFNVYFKADRVDYGKNGYESINLKNNPNLMSDSIYLYNLLFMNKPAFVPTLFKCGRKTKVLCFYEAGYVSSTVS